MRRTLTWISAIALVLILPVTAQEKGPANAASVAGRWNLSMTTPHGPMTMRLEIAVDGKKVSGWMTSDQFGRLPLKGEYVEARLTFVVTAEAGDLTFTGKLKDRDTLVGDMASHAGDLPCLATRIKEK